MHSGKLEKRWIGGPRFVDSVAQKHVLEVFLHSQIVLRAAKDQILLVTGSPVTEVRVIKRQIIFLKE